MNIQLDPELFKTVVSKAIMDSLSPEKREEVLQAAVAHLLTPPRDAPRYSQSSLSPLQEAFNTAVYNVARDVVGEMLKSDAGIREHVDKLVRDAFQRAITVGYDGLVDEVSKSIAAALRFKERY